LRWERAESSRLAWAFAISLAVHLLIFGGYYTGMTFHWWDNFRWPSWLRPVQQLVEAFKKKEPPVQVPLPAQEIPLMFVDVSPAQATVEPPKDAHFYSSQNSQAANPEPDKQTEVPKIDGVRTEVVKTEDVPRRTPQPLQPAAPALPTKEEQPEEKAKSAQTPGDMTMAKPETNPKPDDGEKAQSKPKTWKEAMARQQQQNRLAGQKMKQEGGVKRRLDFSSLNVKATPFGAYDAALIEAVQSRWFTLLDQRDYASDSRGRVVLTFRLHYDGRITDMNTVENSAGEVLGLICEKAVLDPAPYPTWPNDMRLANRGDVRDIQFTFYYY